MLLEKKIDFKVLKDLGLENLLSTNLVKNAVNSRDVNALRDLIFSAVKELENNNITMENYYYGKYIVMSDELFDMFTLKTIIELFEAFGYECIEERIDKELEELEGNENGYIAGKLTISKDDLKLETDIILSMHDSLITSFIDTKELKIK